MSTIKQNHCNYFVLRKKRYCKMLVKAGEQFCGEHRPLNNSQHSKNHSEDHLRIQCPLDRKHTCYASKLKKHLKICNARVTKIEPFISKDVNTGKNDFANVHDSDKIHKTLSSYSATDILDIIKRLNHLYKKYGIHELITENICKHDIVETEMENPIYGDKTKKHLVQASAIVGLLEKYKMFGDNFCYIEFGAGRGQLSYWIAKSSEKYESKILLVERASPKHKKDNKLANTSDDIIRIRADIGDLVLDKIDFLSNSDKLVGVTKHLCGEATDLAIRCVTNSTANVHGVVLTFCCHHRCKWVPYTGRSFFIENSLTEKDFDLMCGISSWATCGTGLSREKRKSVEATEEQIFDKNTDIGFTRLEKEEIGRRAKNLINYGRLVYLQNLGYKYCYLHYYTDKNITLENVCIVAYC